MSAGQLANKKTESAALLLFPEDLIQQPSGRPSPALLVRVDGDRQIGDRHFDHRLRLPVGQPLHQHPGSALDVAVTDDPDHLTGTVADDGADERVQSAVLHIHDAFAADRAGEELSCPSVVVLVPGEVLVDLVFRHVPGVARVALTDTVVVSNLDLPTLDRTEVAKQLLGRLSGPNVAGVVDIIRQPERRDDARPGDSALFLAPSGQGDIVIVSLAQPLSIGGGLQGEVVTAHDIAARFTVSDEDDLNRAPPGHIGLVGWSGRCSGAFLPYRKRNVNVFSRSLVYCLYACYALRLLEKNSDVDQSFENSAESSNLV